ncbi:Sensitivity To Red Light Reduced-like, SRR1 [Kalmanozyma brasiliensis GHG001]|uniref:Sensitivity To Red Light Reduced-like, SRR1 n=1 Tax=Kalmanozyma brasiliensis (strain GHG001) TaxID=1365824 RepID=UPI001CEBD8DA|nr:Sensitivity To Red Light Reduced-like, SRR1 [Kalmanozyma brasiliensis GHG001]KAF6767088.1 Sensitivity To Red Light Reduced-like, SRR1 [Kalmanozyma brasiliensis GHG001]
MASTPSTATQAPEEEPFTFVRSRRRPAPTPAHPGKSVSSSTGLTGPSTGFNYSSPSTSSSGSGLRRNAKRNGKSEQQLVEEQMVRARHAVDTFVRYLGSELCRESKGKGREGREGRRSYAEELAESVRDVWAAASVPEANTSGSIATSSNTGELETTPAPAASAPPSTSSASSAAAVAPSAQDAESIEGRPARPQRIVCLGLGSPLTSRSAQIQLALLVVLRDYLLMLNTGLDDEHRCGAEVQGETKWKGGMECVAYDPVFTVHDVGLLKLYGVAVAPSTTVPGASDSISESDAAPPSDSRTAPRSKDPHSTPPPSEAKSIESYYTNIRTPTLLYMPHCDRELYEEVLVLNYPDDNADAGRQVVLLSNLLTNYTLHNSSLETSYPTLARLVNRFQVRELPNWESGKKASPLKRDTVAHEGTEKGEREEQDQAVLLAEFARLWDRNALRDLGFHWL